MWLLYTSPFTSQTYPHVIHARAAVVYTVGLTYVLWLSCYTCALSSVSSDVEMFVTTIQSTIMQNYDVQVNMNDCGYEFA